MNIVRFILLITLSLVFLAGCCSTCPQGEEDNGESSELENALAYGFSYDNLGLETLTVSASGEDVNPRVSPWLPIAVDVIPR